MECFPQLSCEDLRCHAFAECVQVMSQPTCQCVEGYKGDGVHDCRVIPTEMTLNGYADEEQVELKPEKAIRHNYEIANYGSQTVGGVLIHLSVPMTVRRLLWFVRLQSNPYKMFEADFQPSWPSRPKKIADPIINFFMPTKSIGDRNRYDQLFINEVVKIITFRFGESVTKIYVVIFFDFDEIFVSCGQIS